MTYRLSLMVATGCGLGYLPAAPGTFASIAAALVYYGAYLRTGGIPPDVHVSALGAITVLGVLASDNVVRNRGLHDPSFIVIDEIAGQLASFVLLPVRPSLILAGVILFRIFDIWKPFGIRRLESLENGVGVLADDLAGGLLTCALLHAAYRLFTAWC
ncbi:MAG: phosphatidylglycerophosphatase A [Acidobacteria bacterium]|nr:phosphatidylglycerophosphatase A [Acidobacteriota bacterium]